MTKVYAIYANSDMTEGRGPMHLVCLYDNAEAALEHIRNAKGVMGYGKPENVKLNTYGSFAYGNDHSVEEKNLLTSYTDRKAEIQQAARAAALKKLTAAERELLGVK
ncbi:MAG: hypothetical protein EOO61_03290 [Hymenobacter sp.]|nr:MAG: hypothetical protein EOO61_03290 [Hymenobacter sp.]